MNNGYEVHLGRIKEKDSNYLYSIEGACELLNGFLDKIKYLEELVGQNKFITPPAIFMLEDQINIKDQLLTDALYALKTVPITFAHPYKFKSTHVCKVIEQIEMHIKTCKNKENDNKGTL